jgi:hypothetical protein
MFERHADSQRSRRCRVSRGLSTAIMMALIQWMAPLVQADEKPRIATPTEGAQIGRGDRLVIKIQGAAGKHVSVLWLGPDVQVIKTINLTLDEYGEASSRESSIRKEGAGDYILQLRDGHDNVSGRTLDSRGFVIVKGTEEITRSPASALPVP